MWIILTWYIVFFKKIKKIEKEGKWKNDKKQGFISQYI